MNLKSEISIIILCIVFVGLILYGVFVNQEIFSLLEYKILIHIFLLLILIFVIYKFIKIPKKIKIQYYGYYHRFIHVLWGIGLIVPLLEFIFGNQFVISPFIMLILIIVLLLEKSFKPED